MVLLSSIASNKKNCDINGTMQVYPDGIRHIRSDKRVNEWKTPGKKAIVRCAVNQRQVIKFDCTVVVIGYSKDVYCTVLSRL